MELIVQGSSSEHQGEHGLMCSDRDSRSDTQSRWCVSRWVCIRLEKLAICLYTIFAYLCSQLENKIERVCKMRVDERCKIITIISVCCKANSPPASNQLALRQLSRRSPDVA
eukprot:1158599-Pelagomonas_calceolata.AAC.9